MRPGNVWGVVALLLAVHPAAAQSQAASPDDATGRSPAALAIGPVPETSRLLQIRPAVQLHPASPSELTDRLRLVVPRQRNRAGHALIGGLIGSAAGIVVCTAISNYVKDEGTGFSTCTTSGYVGFALGGFAVGALIGALIK